MSELEASDRVLIEPSHENGGPSPLEEKIIRQIEYYFGDRNMPRDKFLQQAAASGDNGFVPIVTLLTFNRLKALSSDAELIAKAVRKANSTIVELSEDGLCIRRHPDKPLPDIFSPVLRKVIKSKTLYVKGFPVDTTLDTLQAHFESFGQVEHIQMRRTSAEEGRTFKGSVFVEFSNQTIAENYLSMPDVKFDATKLFKESKDQYFERKNEEKRSKKALTKEPSRTEAQPVKKEPVVRQKGSVLHFKGCAEKPTWEAIKEVFSEHATVAFVDFSTPDRSEGFVRFQEEHGASKALEGLTKDLTDDEQPKLLGVVTELRVLAGVEEEDYWTRLNSDKKAKASGYKGRAGQKRRFSKRRDERPTKQSKTEE